MYSYGMRSKDFGLILTSFELIALPEYLYPFLQSRSCLLFDEVVSKNSEPPKTFACRCSPRKCYVSSGTKDSQHSREPQEANILPVTEIVAFSQQV